ncbi:hypothetical protein [Amycolatopsis sp. lyj-23]|uniref:hypothetical protein n=1 Tax=Amycolatopsis sp. lyj-23 TaxID=2789283 RepID=UPI003979E943
MTPVERALIISACAIGWTLVEHPGDTEAGVVLTRRRGDRVEMLTYVDVAGPAVVISRYLDGREHWRHEVPALTALYWATGEHADDAPLVEHERARDAARRPGTSP